MKYSIDNRRWAFGPIKVKMTIETAEELAALLTLGNICLPKGLAKLWSDLDDIAQARGVEVTES